MLCFERGLYFVLFMCIILLINLISSMIIVKDLLYLLGFVTNTITLNFNVIQ
jgi:hypothetical protein